jgi:hypothetical protein
VFKNLNPFKKEMPTTEEEDWCVALANVGDDLPGEGWQWISPNYWYHAKSRTTVDLDWKPDEQWMSPTLDFKQTIVHNKPLASTDFKESRGFEQGRHDDYHTGL